jgi:UPF0176 protein
MGKPEYQILLYYKYIKIDNPEDFKNLQRQLCRKLNLKGRIIVAKEGINGTVEGLTSDTEEYIKEFTKDGRFKDIQFKKSEGTGSAFPKLSIKVRNEIVAYRLGTDDIEPWKITGKYLTPEEVHHWFKEKKEFYIIDMRNGFEQEVGFFENSFLTGWEHSANLPDVLKRLESIPKEATVLTVCTGGVRCEKASGFLVKHGFKNVYQLYGGIHSYIEKYPGENFKGVLYTFDNRLVMGFNLDDPSREVVGRCAKCGNPSENLINCLDDFCHRHFIACLKCLNGEKAILCPMGCRDYSKEHPEAFA